MKSRVYLTPFLVLVGILLVLGVMFAFQPSRHQGDVVRCLEDLAGSNLTAKRQAEQKIKRWGEKAVPIIVREMCATDSALKMFLVNLTRKQSFVNVQFKTADERRLQAGLAFNLVASKSHKAVPDIMKALHHRNPDVRFGAAAFLYHIAKVSHDADLAVPDLISTLSETNRHVMAQTIMALQAIGDPATNAIPKLIEIVENVSLESWVRYPAIRALGSIGGDLSGMIPVLVRVLDSEDRLLVTAGVQSIGQLGTEAVEAIPALLGTLQREGLGQGPDFLKELAHTLVLVDPGNQIVLPEIIRRMAREDQTTRGRLIKTLMFVAQEKEQYFPILKDGLYHPDPNVAAWMANQIGGLGEIATPAVPALLEVLYRPGMSINAATALGWIGPSARGAIPHLLELYNEAGQENDFGKMKAMERAIKEIDARIDLRARGD